MGQLCRVDPGPGAGDAGAAEWVPADRSDRRGGQGTTGILWVKKERFTWHKLFLSDLLPQATSI